MNKYISKIAVCIAALLTAVFFTSCAGKSGGEQQTSPNLPVTAGQEVTLSETELMLELGGEGRIEVLSAPEGANIAWSSGNTSVATVTDGNVTAVGFGSAMITARSGTLGAYCTVYVTERLTALPQLVLSKSTLTLSPGAEYPLTAAVYVGSELQSGADIEWSAEADGVLFVDGGIITAIANGNAVVTASTKYNGISLTADCIVNVTAMPHIVVIGVPDILDSRLGATYTAQSKLIYNNGYYSVDDTVGGNVLNFLVTSDDTAIVSVEGSVLTINKGGYCNITVDAVLLGNIVASQTAAVTVLGTVTATFMADGVSYDVQSLFSGDTAEPPADPQLSGKVFMGWLDSNGNEFDFDAPLYTDTEMTALLLAERKLVSNDKNKDGMTPNWFMNYMNVPLIYTTDEAYGSEAGSVLIPTKYSTEYPGSPNEVTFNNVNMSGYYEVYFRIKIETDKRIFVYFGSANFGKRVELAGDGNWHEVRLIRSQADKFDIYIDGTLSEAGAVFANLNSKSLCFHTDTPGIKSPVEVYVSAVYGLGI